MSRLTMQNLAEDTLDKDKRKEEKELKKRLGGSFDFARPQQWNDRLRDEMNINPRFYVWEYPAEGENSIGGKPTNLAEEWVAKYLDPFYTMKYILTEISNGTYFKEGVDSFMLDNIKEVIKKIEEA